MTDEQRTLDLSKPRLGHAFQNGRVLDDGQRLAGFIFIDPLDQPRVGDYVILPTSDPAKPTTRYQVEVVEWCRNPEDMWRVEMKFAPRANATRDEDYGPTRSELVRALYHDVLRAGRG